MTARENFVSNVRAIEAALALAELQDAPLNDAVHNRRAHVARAGLAVVSFSVVERFLRERSAEATRWIRNRGLSSVAYSDEMRSAATIDALQGIRFQADLLRRSGEDPTTFVQQQVRHIHESSTTVAFAEPCFFHDKPNINKDDIAAVLRVFRVPSGWQQLLSFGRRSGTPLLSAVDAFKNAAVRRHLAAHQGGPALPTGDLVNFLKEAIGICLAFDALLSRACAQFVSRDPAYLRDGVDGTSIPITFIVYKNGWYRELDVQGQRAVVRKRALEDILPSAIPRAISRRGFIVIRAANGIPVDWRTCDIEPH